MTKHTNRLKCIFSFSITTEEEKILFLGRKLTVLRFVLPKRDQLPNPTASQMGLQEQSMLSRKDQVGIYAELVNTELLSES